ncbi:MAG TPA: ATP-binding protein [Candidatus Brocadiia bacterium]|nr:ATP-binding protein [Candidatus Brocadiia bacterium]
MIQQPQTRQFRSVTSVRLGIGFGIVLSVFAFTVYVALSRFEDMQKSNRKVKERQDSREIALNLGNLAQDLFFIELDFERTGNYSYLGEVEGKKEEIDRLADELQARSEDAIERGWILELRNQVDRIHDLCSNQLNEAVTKKDKEQIERVMSASRETLITINELNARLGRFLEGKTWDAHQESLRLSKSSAYQAYVLAGLAVVVAVAAILVTRRSIVRPINKLAAGTEAIAEGDLNRTIEVRGQDEFAHLAARFNDMTRRLRTNQEQLLRAERMVTIGQLAAGVAHEINNPIAVILGYTKMLLTSLDPESDEYQDVSTIQEEAFQCKKIVEDLLHLARPARTQPEVVAVGEVIDEIISMGEKLGLTQGVEIVKDIQAGPMKMVMDRTRLRQVALNIIINALDAMKECTVKRLRVTAMCQAGPYASSHAPMTEQQQERRYLVLTVEDTGPGMAPETLRRIFEPFFTTKSHGTGLGLAIAHGIVRAHGGSIDVESDGSTGSTFHVSLRIVEDEDADSTQSGRTERGGVAQEKTGIAT